MWPLTLAQKRTNKTPEQPVWTSTTGDELATCHIKALINMSK